MENVFASKEKIIQSSIETNGFVRRLKGEKTPSMNNFPTGNGDDKTFHRERSSRIYLNFFGIFSSFAKMRSHRSRSRERSQRCVLRISRVYCWCYCLPNTKKLSLPNKVSHLMCRTRAPTAEFIEESENSRLGNSPTIPFVLLFWFITLSLLQQAGSGAGGFGKKIQSYGQFFIRNRTTTSSILCRHHQTWSFNSFSLVWAPWQNRKEIK